MMSSRLIGNQYKIVKPLFQVKSYLYAQNRYCHIGNEALTQFFYQNEDPSKALKMLGQKLDMGRNDFNNLIFPTQHIKEQYCDKHISLFFMQDFVVPLRMYQKKNMSIPQFLQMLHGALSCLHQLHMRDVIHGNISINTCYILKQRQEQSCKFALNILDTVYFTEQQYLQGAQDKLFQSEGQALGLKVSFKDDLESLVYVIAHILTKGKLFTVQRFQLQWITQTQLLRWKSCDFFKEMISKIPKELQILLQIYTIAKSLRRNQKPDYLKLMKKILLIMGDYNIKQVDRKIAQNSTLQQMSLTRKMKPRRQPTDKKIKLRIQRPIQTNNNGSQFLQVKQNIQPSLN